MRVVEGRPRGERKVRTLTSEIPKGRLKCVPSIFYPGVAQGLSINIACSAKSPKDLETVGMERGAGQRDGVTVKDEQGIGNESTSILAHYLNNQSICSSAYCRI